MPLQLARTINAVLRGAVNFGVMLVLAGALVTLPILLPLPSFIWDLCGATLMALGVLTFLVAWTALGRPTPRRKRPL